MCIRDRSKEKRAAERMKSVDAGAKELHKWLQDQVRIGLLELPNRPYSDFQKLAARMVDAKANGLAGWVRALGDVDYGDMKNWQDQASAIMGKMHLLLETWQNYDNLSEEWQHSIRTLMGWSQSSKELIQDKSAPAMKDQWLVLGREVEEKDEIQIQREWLWGCHSGQQALILSFGTRFHKIDSQLPHGSVLEAEVAFFPGIIKHRAIVRMKKDLTNRLPLMPGCLPDLIELSRAHRRTVKEFPWANNQCYLVADCRLAQGDEGWHLCDTSGNNLPLVTNFSVVKKWFLFCGNQAVNTAVVKKQEKLLVLGIFSESKYFALC